MQAEVDPFACTNVVVGGVFTLPLTSPVPALPPASAYTPGVATHTLGREESCKRAAKQLQKVAGVKLLKTIGLGFSDGTAMAHSSQADTFASQFAVNFRLNKKSAESLHHAMAEKPPAYFRHLIEWRCYTA